MPLASGASPQIYRFALLAGLAIPVVAAVLGLLPVAFATAAVVVPLVYLVYLYDVNEWEDQPVPVVLGAIALAGAASLAFTLLWHEVILDGGAAILGRVQDVQAAPLLVTGLLVPVVALLLCQLGPIALARSPRFDDLIDGLTFGVAAGAAYAAVETLVVNADLILDSANRVDNPSAGLWISLVLTSGLLKPVVYGSAAGLCVAAFSGIGRGYAGFGTSYLRALAEAAVAVVAFAAGLHLTARLDGATGATAGLVWGLIVTGYLVLRVRMVLHAALLEGALEAAAGIAAGHDAVDTLGFCGECAMPLVHASAFCGACGTAVRAAPKQLRLANASSPDHDDVAPDRRDAPVGARGGQR